MVPFTPGPTPVLESVRVAMSEPTIHHRTPEFENIFANARNKLFNLINMNEVVVLASSGTGAMEACITNISKNRVLTINAGKFGERFGKIVRSHNLELVELKYSWDTPASIEDILDIIKQDGGIDTVAIEICESAGGLRHPVEDIAKAVKELNPNIAVRAIRFGVSIDHLMCSLRFSALFPGFLLGCVCLC